MGKTILIIEDDYKNLSILSYVLEFYGYKVIAVNDGNEGVKSAKENKPDLIFMDVQMPAMDGFAAAKMIKNYFETKDTKIIGITSYAMKCNREKVLQSGFDDYILRPINARQVPELVKKHLEVL